MAEYATAALVGIGVLGVLAQWLAWRVHMPAILFLLIIGILVGPVAGWLSPDALFGDLLFPFISLAVAVVLFEGSLTLHLEDLRGLGSPVRRLLTLGVLITWCCTTVAAHYLVGLSWELALLFGAITVVTGPTVIAPLLRTVRPNTRIASVLRWEGIIIDPIGALMTVLVFQFLVSSGASPSIGGTLATFGLIVAVGIAIGVLAGWLLGLAIRHYWLPDYLHSIGTLVAVMGVFFLANQIFHESGLLAVTIMGIWLGNMRRVPLEEVLNFKESLSLLLLSGLFILLAARVAPADLLALGWGAAALLAVMQLVIRPLNVVLCTLGSALDWRERTLIAWVAPRGIVAAAVSALFALRLMEAGYQGAALLAPLTFLVILFTVILQSATARPLAGLLRVREPPPRGALVLGANTVGRAIGGALQELEFPVLLADANWDNIQQARMQGLPVYYGNPVSEHADRHLDLTGIGRLLALSPRADLNTLGCLHFAKEFGQRNVFRLPPGETDSGVPAEIRRRHRHDNLLFGAEATYAKLASALSRGAAVRATGLTERFDFDAYRELHGSRGIPLLAVDTRGRLRVFGEERDVAPGAGWTVVGLIQPDEAEMQAAGREAEAEGVLPGEAASQPGR